MRSWCLSPRRHKTWVVLSDHSNEYDWAFGGKERPISSATNVQTFRVIYLMKSWCIFVSEKELNYSVICNTWSYSMTRTMSEIVLDDQNNECDCTWWPEQWVWSYSIPRTNRVIALYDQNNECDCTRWPEQWVRSYSMTRTMSVIELGGGQDDQSALKLMPLLIEWLSLLRFWC